MKITIIGCGYVGKTIAKQWYQAGHYVTATTTTPAKISELASFTHQVEIVQGNDLTTLKKICAKQDVILLTVGSKGRTEEKYRFAYLETAQNLQKALVDNYSVKQIIYTSSYSVVGNHHGEWIDESTPDKPMNVFAEILLETEKVLHSIATENRHVCILRLGGIYGENREILKIFRNTMGQTKAGTGAEYGNWVHLEDISRSIEFVRENNLGGLYYLVGDEPIQRREMLAQLARKYNLPPVIWDTSQPSPRIFDARVSNQKIKSAGFTFKYPRVQL